MGGSATGGLASDGNPAGGVGATGGKPTGGVTTVMSGGSRATAAVTTGGSAAGGTTTGGTTVSSPVFGGTSGAGTVGKVTGGNSAAGGAAFGGVLTTAGAAAAAGAAATAGASGANSSSAATTNACSTTNALSGGTPHCDENSSSSYGPYEWQLWSVYTKGCLTTYNNSGAAFSASWNDSGDFLAKVGFVFDGTKTAQELGTLSADFAETHSGSAGGASYIGIYGWSASPNVEFFIVENALDDSPPMQPAGGSKLGTIKVDGGNYDVYSSALTATMKLRALYSIRQNRRSCGHVSISEQFSRWANLGFSLGKIDEVRIAVETLGGTGRIDFTTATMTVN
jgi:hypothetical protein